MVNLLDGVSVSSSTEIESEIVLTSCTNDSFSRSLHSVFETRMDNVLFASTSDFGLEAVGRLHRDFSSETTFKGFLNTSEQEVIGISFVFEGQTTERDVVKVLQPFEEGNSDTTTVDEHVGDDQAISTLEKDLVGSWGSRSVGSFSNDFSLDAVSVSFVDSLFTGSRDEDVAFFEHEFIEGFEVLGSGESFDGAVFQFVVFEFLGMDTLGVVDSRIPFLNSNADSSITVEVTHGVKTYITETLDDESLSGEASCKTNFVHVFLIIDENFKTLPDTTSGSRDTSMNTSGNNS